MEKSRISWKCFVFKFDSKQLFETNWTAEHFQYIPVFLVPKSIQFPYCFSFNSKKFLPKTTKSSKYFKFHIVPMSFVNLFNRFDLKHDKQFQLLLRFNKTTCQKEIKILIRHSWTQNQCYKKNWNNRFYDAKFT